MHALSMPVLTHYICFPRYKPYNASWTRYCRRAYFAAASFSDAQVKHDIGGGRCQMSLPQRSSR